MLEGISKDRLKTNPGPSDNGLGNFFCNMAFYPMFQQRLSGQQSFRGTIGIGI